MEKQKGDDSVFMCQLCNLFSPSRGQLLTHCSQSHPQQEPPDDIIITLQRLVTESVETLKETPKKRKRGRPKGSTKKNRTDWTEAQADSTHPSEDTVPREEERHGEKDGTASTMEGESLDGISALECKECHRSFSNRRQILKHICRKEDEEEEEEEMNGSVGVGGEGSPRLDSVGADLSQSLQNQTRAELETEKHMNSFRPIKTNKRSFILSDDQSHGTKETGLAPANRKPVISVLLAEDETLPGISRMVPVEDCSTETDSTAIHTDDVQPQDSATIQVQSQDITSESTDCRDNPATDQETGCNSVSTVARRGFQEYAIKQDATSLLQSQLKIFTCEFCYKIFKFRHSLIAHLRTHTQEKPFHCPHCDYASAIKANLNVHLRKHTGEKFSCQHCPFTCLSPGHLKVHTERVHLKVKQHCSFCQKKYSDVKNLLKHIEKRHDLKDTTIYQNYQQLRLKTRQGLRQLLYHCSSCNRRFKNQVDRDRHLLIHGSQLPFRCLLCDHAATKMARLIAHVRKHLFLYVCCQCEGRFVSCHRLKSHLKESHPELDEEQAFTDCINSSYYLIQPGKGMWGEEEPQDGQKGVEEQKEMEEGTHEERTGVEDTRNGTESDGWRFGEGEGGELSEEKEQENEAKCQDESPQEGQMEGEMTIELDSECRQEDFQEKILQIVTTESTTPTGRQKQEAIVASDWSEEVVGEKSQDTSRDTCCTPEDKNRLRYDESTQTLLSSQNIRNNTTQENTRPTDDSLCAENDALLTSEISNSPCLRRDALLSSARPAEESLSSSDKLIRQSAFQQVVSSLQKTRLSMKTFKELRKIYGDLECQYCGKLFWYKVHYNAHVRTHTKEHLHYCLQCSYSSITKSSLKRHMVQKHSGVLLSCPNSSCKYTTPDKYKLQAHLRTHQEQVKSITCSLCQQSYPEHRLKQHIKTSHPDSVAVQGKGLMMKRAEKCPYCDSYFLKNSSDFQQHIWAHQGLKPYLCTMCDYAGRSKSNLKTHMNRHSTERCHLCDLCGKKFKSKVTLKSHRLSHTNEGKRFQCSECDFTAVSKPSLLRHMEQHSEFKPFRCAHCHYSCNIAGPLKRHYNKKHPDRKYENAGPGLPNPDELKQHGGMKCPVCEFVYGTKWELNRHLKTKHGLKLVDGTWQVVEGGEAKSAEDKDELTEAPVGALQESSNDAVNILQQITEFSSKAHDAVTSMVAMPPGTIAVVEQVADEQEVSTYSDQLMVVNAEDALTDADHVMVVEEADGLEALTVLTQGDDTHHYIVYVQEQTVEIN
ncbi:zinc finger protein ZFAT-like [Thalassophryne amazonica]|uniref:zinc finger protein ZFAT-like n=1 Tax=Thalassophryne amazonica TaxID=390379 RepID=UPI001471BAEC|nr:zinc finger protein ZFAT-like [Thalassophryne amazonica]